MSTCFPSTDDAIGYFAYCLGIPVSEVSEVKDGLRVGGPATLLLDPADKSPEAEAIRKSEADRASQQRTFKAKSPKSGEEVTCVIGPFRSGFDLWIVAPSGAAVRL